MLKRKIFNSLFLLVFVCFSNLSGQGFFYKSGSIKIKKAEDIVLTSKTDIWSTKLENVTLPKPGGEIENSQLGKIKNTLQKKYPRKKAYQKTEQSFKTNGLAPSPTIEKNFEGNFKSSGTPLDNDIAISNDGRLVSVVNSSIYVFNIDSLEETPWESSLEVFATSNSDVPKDNPLTKVNNKFDPKVVYDPEADRFIIVMLNGYNTTYSKLILAFSKTNDPTKDWNIYVLPGNPLNNGLWSDYPQIAITKEDFFLTINLLTDSTQGGQKPWELAFRDDIIWQINKEEGYSGADTLTPNYYHDLVYNGKLIQYICPVKSGDDILENNIFLLSNNAFSLGNDTIFLIEISSSLSSGPNSISLKHNNLDVKYYVPPDVEQANNGDSLFTNDARILGGFYHNDQIQFVFPTLDTNSGRSAIYHGIISDITESDFKAMGRIIGSQYLDFAFPNISLIDRKINFSGNSSRNNESIITMEHSSASAFPGISCISYNNDGNYSDLIEVKRGDTLINSNPNLNQKERWGDYTGSQTKFDENGKIWISGTYGSKGTTGKLKKASTWIAELKSQNNTIPQQAISELQIFPNPSQDIFSLNFELEQSADLAIKIIDSRGCIVKQWTENKAQTGQNIFSFSSAPLSAGVYSVSIETTEKIILRSRLVKI